MYQGISARAAEQGLSDHEYFVLSTLTVRDSASAAELDAMLEPVGIPPAAELLERLHMRGLVQPSAGTASGFALTPRGLDATLHVIAAAKAIEADLLGRIGYGNGLALKQLLQQVCRALGGRLPDLWAPAL